jgi:hypothetical protein
MPTQGILILLKLEIIPGMVAKFRVLSLIMITHLDLKAKRRGWQMLNYFNLGLNRRVCSREYQCSSLTGTSKRRTIANNISSI